MRVIITGASGFIGRNVLLRAPAHWEVLAVGHTQGDLPAFVEAHGLTRVQTFRCDLTSPDQVRALASSVGHADAVLYLAANGDPAASTERPAWDLSSNTVALVNVLDHCHVDHVVFVSSGAVYDGLVGDVSPASAIAPRLPYAISKHASEQYLRFFAERRRSIGSAIAVRFFGAYGPHEPERKITTRWMRAAMRGQREFVVRGDGENLIDFMYVDDAVAGFVKLTESPGRSTTVDFASGAPVTVNDVVRTMARTLGVEVRLSHQGHTDEYIRFRTVDTSMREQFGIVPTTPFADGMMRLHTFLLGEGASPAARRSATGA